MSNEEILLQDLPLEILLDILLCDAISFDDICRIACVSKAFQSVAGINSLWQAKFAKMWPSLALEYDANGTDWKSEFQMRFDCKNAVLQQLKSVSADCYYSGNVSSEDAYRLQTVCPDHPLSLQIILDELSEIINDGKSDSNLTLKYYAEMTMRYLRHIYLGIIWRNFLANDKKKFTLLKGAILISQWCEPTDGNCTSNVLNNINEIIKLSYEEVRKRSPHHPVLKKDVPLLFDDNQETLLQSSWTTSECRVIIQSISYIMFEEMKFFANSDLFSNTRDTFVEKVLASRVGHPISLCIIYEAVATQMGVSVSPVSLPGKFALKWLDKPSISGREAYLYMNVFEKGKFLPFEKMLDIYCESDTVEDSWAEALPNLKVFTSICWNLVELARMTDTEGKGGLIELCNTLELLSILTPNDKEHKLLLVRVYNHLCMNIPRVYQLLQEIQELDPNSTGIVSHSYRLAVTAAESVNRKSIELKKKCQRRAEGLNVTFTIGMVMVHKKYMYRCVLYGWDAKCTASRDWIMQMGVHTLKDKDNQPFYQVLGCDGSNRYVAQENLEFDDSGEPIPHPEIGRYFDTFCGQYYHPNDQKHREYPDDIAILERKFAPEENDIHLASDSE